MAKKQKVMTRFVIVNLFTNRAVGKFSKRRKNMFGYIARPFPPKLYKTRLEAEMVYDSLSPLQKSFLRVKEAEF